jgi:hypothetical protein
LDDYRRLDTLGTVQIVRLDGTTISPCGAISTSRCFDLGEVNMRESLPSRKRESLSVFGISFFLLAVCVIAAVFFLPLHAAARELPSPQNHALADWQRYVAWHPSWHYLALEEDCAVDEP